MRNFSGHEQFDALKTTVVDAYSNLFPIRSKTGEEMKLKRVWVDDKDLELHDYAAQKKARLAGQTWGAPVYAHIELKDKEGKVIDSMDRIRLATIPRLTPRGSYIVGGNEYQVNNQLRRKPGAYVVKTSRGDYKATFNLAGEHAKNFELHFDPDSNRYKIRNVAGTSSSFGLYPLLQALGVSDQTLQKSWGGDILAANKYKSEADTLKLAKLITHTHTDNLTTAREALTTWAKGAKVDPQVAQFTHGKPYETLHPDMVLATSKRLLNVVKGEDHPDDPESLLFKEVLSAEDMLHDKLNSKKQVTAMQGLLGRHLGRRTKLRDMIDFKKLSAPVENFFTFDSRASLPEQHNPVQMLSNLHKLTMRGTGGITDPHTITNELREVHPSQLGFVDPVHTPEGQDVGTMLHIAAGVKKDGREIRSQVYNVRTGKTEYLTPRELYTKTVAFPDEAKFEGSRLKWKSGDIRTQKDGKVSTVKASAVDYVFPSAHQLFGYSTNLIPFLHNDAGTRSMFAGKMLEQAIPLIEREAPLVQTSMGEGKTFQEMVGSQTAVKSPHAGTITAVHPDYIMVDKTKVPVYNNFPLNQKTMIHHAPSVKVGDVVKSGQLLADSNFSRDGVLALGKNLKVAYLAYPGLTFEDGIVITESAAKKLAAQVLHKEGFQTEPGKRETGLRKFATYYPNAIPHKDFGNYEADGVIKKGMIVQPGQVIIAGLHNNLASPENMTLKRINKALQLPWGNSAVRYKGEFAGEVIDVSKTAAGITVYIKSTEIAKESDKLAGTHGNKGVITRVIPDKDAPHTADGTIPDIMLNPHGIIGRINIGQVYESAASKIAKKTGKPYIVENFDGIDTQKKITAELKAHGIDDKEEMFLPNGKSMGRVSIGNPYILRMVKTGKSGFSARMPGSGYDLNMQPTKGGEEGTKSLDLMTFYSMLSHGAKKNLLDAHNRSEKNDEYWHAIEMGRPLPAPKPTFVWNKFMSLLHGAGINPVKPINDPVVTLTPMTDKDTAKLSRGKINDFNFLYGKNMKEVKGGLFDPTVTGGMFGDRYSHLELHEALPNPVFEKAIKSLTGLRGPDYEAVLDGAKHISSDGKLITGAVKGSVTGGAGVKKLLSQIDVNQEIAKAQSALKTAKGGALDAHSKKLRYLTALKELNMSPSEAYMRKDIPVIPPKYRPVYDMPGRGLVISPANRLYQNTGLLNHAATLPVMKLLGDEDKRDLKADLYSSTRAIAGLEDVMTLGKDHPIEGFISQITSDKPKAGFFLSKLINRRQDLTGRAVLSIGHDLGIDQVGIPEKMAWKIFRPFTVREFVANGHPPDIARKEIDDKTPRAKQMLDAAMKKRTVLLNRAPSLHKFSVMAFKPVMTSGLALRMPPLTFKGLGADCDGDTITVHVPTSEEAVRESYKMFPSNNLFKPGTGNLMVIPTQESAIGLYLLSQTEAGRKQINTLIPSAYHVKSALDKKSLGALFNDLARKETKDYARDVMSLKLLGDKVAYERGFSVGVEDVGVNLAERDKKFAAADKTVATLRANHKPGAVLDKHITDAYQKASKESFTGIEQQLKDRGNNFYHMVHSGARGSPDQLRQIVSAPGVMNDAKGKPVTVPIRKSYAEGLSTADYMTSSYSVRKNMMDKSLQTSQPGALNKDIMASTLDNIVTSNDCGVKKGIVLPIGSTDALDRYTSKDQHGIHRNTLITPQVVSSLKKRGINTIEVRSPLQCLAPKGTCGYCFGLDEHGQVPAIGENIGVRSGQAMSEPMTQLVMKTFHTGGVAGEGATYAQGFERVQQLLRMPAYIAGEATLATKTGKITAIKGTSAGGHVVTIDDIAHSIRPGHGLKIKLGDRVQSGDLLSEGILRPQAVQEHKGMEAAQNYIVDELQKAYHSQGIPMQRKIFETVVRSFGNMTRVKTASKQFGVSAGDIIPFTVAEHYNATRALELPTHESVGYRLRDPISNLPKFHEITAKDVDHLKGLGYNKLDVVKDPLIHAPIITGIENVPMMRKNWLAQLGYRKIKETLTEGASQGWKSNVEGNHPIPAFAFGARFGTKKEHY